MGPAIYNQEEERERFDFICQQISQKTTFPCSLPIMVMAVVGLAFSRMLVSTQWQTLNSL
ncbi:hypothetical protein GCM10028806_08350 [Spirosoma terrae]